MSIQAGIPRGVVPISVCSSIRCAAVVFHAVSPGDFLAQHLDLLGRCALSMQAGRDQDQDLLARKPRFVQDPQRWPQDRAVGNRPGDIADKDAGALPAAGELAQGRRASGRLSSAWETAVSGSESGGTSRMVNGPTTRSEGKRTFNPVRP